MKDLETKNLKIRKFKMEDVEDVYRNLATIEDLENCSGYNAHKNIYETTAMISSFIKEYEIGELALAIEEKSTSTVIGYIRALEVSLPDKRCDIRFGIAFSKFDDSLIEEALNAVLKYLFIEMNFNIIISKFYDSNSRLTKIKSTILEHVGMQKDAVLRNRKINEKTRNSENLIIYSIIKDEFKMEKHRIAQRKSRIFNEYGSPRTDGVNEADSSLIIKY